MAEQAGIAFGFQGLEKRAQQRFCRAGGAPLPCAVLRAGVCKGQHHSVDPADAELPGRDGACDSPTHKWGPCLSLR